MSKNRLVYILDPSAAEFRSVDLPDLSLTTIKEALGYDAVDTVKFDTDHVIFYNDNGLQHGISHYIRLSGHPDPFVGRILLASSGDADPLLSAQDACARFALYKPVMDPVVTSSRASNGDHTTFISTVEGFDTRIEQFELAVVSGPISNVLALT